MIARAAKSLLGPAIRPFSIMACAIVVLGIMDRGHGYFFSIGTVFDPVTRAQSPLLGSALNMLALVLFFALDGHHMLMRGVAYSLQRVPPGSLPANWSVAPLVDQFGSMFVFGGKRISNPGERTPTIVPGPPPKSTDFPTTFGSPPKCRRQ